MNRIVHVALLLALLLLPRGVKAASAAETQPALATTATVTLVAAANAATATMVQEQTTSGLPERAPPPRTLRAYWHLFIAFAVTWLLVFGYTLTIGRRFRRLEEELRRGTPVGSSQSR